MMTTLKLSCLSKLGQQRGAIIALVAVLIVVFLGLGALAIDLSHLYVVRNELQNAADAGALAGARVLYLDGGATLQDKAITLKEAYDAGTANQAISKEGTISVDFNWNSGDPNAETGDIQRGHWSFGRGTLLAKGFYWNEDGDDTPDLANRTTAQLDDDRDFINAVKVVARRDVSAVATVDTITKLGTSAASFFAKIFGFDDFLLAADAVAYIGFAGSLRPEDIDQPIAICKQAILDPSDGSYKCNTGRMISSAPDNVHGNTGAWTNYSQDPAVQVTQKNFDDHMIDPSICENGNDGLLNFGDGIGLTGGEVTPVFTVLETCWNNSSTPGVNSHPEQPWVITLPVIDCSNDDGTPRKNPLNGDDLAGAVTVEVVWVKANGTDSHWNDIPVKMGDWTCDAWATLKATGLSDQAAFNALTETQRINCWKEFAAPPDLPNLGDGGFDLSMRDGTSVGDLTPSQAKATWYFKPSCDPSEPRGTTGGENYGILAKIPVLVE